MSKEEAQSSYKFEDLIFFIDTNIHSIHPLTDKEIMFEKEFLLSPDRLDLDKYKGELLYRAKLYKLPYKIKIVTGADRYAPGLIVETIYPN